MNRLVVILLLGLSISAGAFAQESDKKSDIRLYNNEFGFNVGACTGLGFSYRHWGDKFGVQLTALPYKIEKEVFISAGLTGMFSMRKTSHVRTFLYLGNHILRKNADEVYDDSYSGYVNGDAETQYNVGFGIGFSLGRIVAFNISAGYGAYNITGGKDEFSLLPTGEIGLYWKF